MRACELSSIDVRRDRKEDSPNIPDSVDRFLSTKICWMTQVHRKLT